MNKNQRKELEKLLEIINEVQTQIDFIKDEEQEKLDNMPENLQNSERYSQMEEIINALLQLNDAQL